MALQYISYCVTKVLNTNNVMALQYLKCHLTRVLNTNNVMALQYIKYYLTEVLNIIKWWHYKTLSVTKQEY